MVSTWWLFWALMGGGCLGFLLFALLAMARDSEDAAPDLRMAHRRAAASGIQATPPLS